MDFNTAYNVIYDINDLLDKFKEKFPDEFQKRWDDILQMAGKTSTELDVSSVKPIDFANILLFGEVKYNENIVKKVDYNKNKSRFKTLLFNIFGIKYSVEILRGFIKEFDHLLEEVNNKFEIIWSKSEEFGNENTLLNTDEINRLYEFICTYFWESNHMISTSMSLKDLLDSVENNKNIHHLNKDTLKRYYFNDVYELKNNIKLFEPEEMCFGEINNIMRIYNKLFDYVFGDMICIYYTLNNHFKVLTNSTAHEKHKKK